MPDELEPQNGADQPAEETSAETVEPQVTELPKLSKEDILRALQEQPELLSEEDTFAIPVVRSRLDRKIQEKDAESKAAIAKAAEEQRRAAADYQEAAAFMQQFQGLETEEKLRFLMDEQGDRRYRNAQRLLSNQSSADPTEVAARIWNNAHSTLKEKYPKANLDDAEDLGMAVDRAAQSVIDERMQGLKAEVEKQVKAQIASLKAQVGLSGVQPDRLDSAAGGGRGLTLAAYNSMSPAERMELRDQHPEQIDEMVARMGAHA